MSRKLYNFKDQQHQAKIIRAFNSSNNKVLIVKPSHGHANTTSR